MSMIWGLPNTICCWVILKYVHQLCMIQVNHIQYSGYTVTIALLITSNLARLHYILFTHKYLKASEKFSGGGQLSFCHFIKEFRRDNILQISQKCLQEFYQNKQDLAANIHLALKPPRAINVAYSHKRYSKRN